MLTSARLTLKQHRFEVGAGALTSIVLGVSALVVTYRLNSIPMPAGCFDAWIRGGGGPLAAVCAGPTQSWASVNENEASRIFLAMAVMPFAVGLIGGVPLVSRELEARTVQTAWFLSGSRVIWLIRQLLPVIVLLGLATSFAALAVDGLEATQVGTATEHVTLHGPIVVARAFAALGIGLLVGSIVGRTLPAFILGVLLCLVLAVAAVPLRLDWLDSQKTVVGTVQASGYSFGVLWRAPNGALLSFDDAYQLVPPGEQQPDVWLFDHGYEQVQLGVTDETVMAWTPYEVVGFSLIGFAAIGATGVVISRRRPT